MPRVTGQPGCIDALVLRQVRDHFPQRFAKLATRAHRVTAGAMIRADSHVNQRLQKEAPRTALRCPGLLQHLVRFEELARIEELDPALKNGIHRSAVSRAPCLYYYPKRQGR